MTEIHQMVYICNNEKNENGSIEKKGEKSKEHEIKSLLPASLRSYSSEELEILKYCLVSTSTTGHVQ